MVKTIADYDIEIERISEWLLNNRGRQITDRNSFDAFFNAEILNKEKQSTLSGIEKQLQERVFDKVRDEKPDVSDKRTRSVRQPSPTNVVVEEKDELGTIKGRVVKIVKSDTINRQGKRFEVSRDSKGRFVKKS